MSPSIELTESSEPKAKSEKETPTKPRGIASMIMAVRRKVPN